MWKNPHRVTKCTQNQNTNINSLKKICIPFSSWLECQRPPSSLSEMIACQQLCSAPARWSPCLGGLAKPWCRLRCHLRPPNIAACAGAADVTPASGYPPAQLGRDKEHKVQQEYLLWPFSPARTDKINMEQCRIWNAALLSINWTVITIITIISEVPILKKL